MLVSMAIKTSSSVDVTSPEVLRKTSFHNQAYSQNHHVNLYDI